MRINEDFLDSVEDIQDEVVQHDDNVKLEHRRPEIVIIFDLEEETDLEVMHKRLSKMLSMYPDVQEVQVLNWRAANVSGEYVDILVPTENGEETFRYNNFLKKYIVPVALWTSGISLHTAYKMCLQFNYMNKSKNGRGVFGTVHVIRYYNSGPEGSSIFPGSISGLIKFNEGETEVFNSSNRNPIRVAFNDFVKCISFLVDERSLAYCWRYVIKKMDLMSTYVSADNESRAEGRSLETLRYIAAETTKYLRTLPSDFVNVIDRIPQDVKRWLTIEVRDMKYEDFLDENLWSKSYRIVTDAFTGIDVQHDLLYSAVGVQHRRDDENKDEMHCGYFEFAAVAAFEAERINILVIKSKAVDYFLSAINYLTNDKIFAYKRQEMQRELIRMLT